MIYIDNISVSNMLPVVTGMRNALASWDLGDSQIFIGYSGEYERKLSEMSFENKRLSEKQPPLFTDEDDQGVYFILGDNDYKLCQKLILAGAASHRKFLRQINVTFDLHATLAFWKQFDTYKVGTVRNSTSTMHKITAEPITIDDFDASFMCFKESKENEMFFNKIVESLEKARKAYLETKDKAYWQYIIDTLPSSYVQMSTITLNYEVLRNMYFDRRHHKLRDWQDFLEILERELPYSYLITMEDRDDGKTRE